MARGHQKEAAQAKALKKSQDSKKGGSQKDAQKEGLKLSCKVCMAPMTHYNVMKQHYESKHPKETCPAIEEFKA